MGINHRGEMAALANCIAPDLVVITMIGQSHLAGLGGIEGVAEEKVFFGGFQRQGNFPGELSPV